MSADVLFNNLDYAGPRSKTPIYGRVRLVMTVLRQWRDIPKEKLPPGRRWSSSETGPVVYKKPKGLFGQIIHAWSRAWTLTVTSYGTDYVLPLVIGALPAITWYFSLLLVPPIFRR